MTQETPKRLQQALDAHWRHIFLSETGLSSPPEIKAVAEEKSLAEVVALAAAREAGECWAVHKFVIPEGVESVHTLRCIQLPAGARLFVNLDEVESSVSSVGYADFDISSPTHIGVNTVHICFPCAIQSASHFGFWRPASMEVFSKPKTHIIQEDLDCNARKKQLRLRFSVSAPCRVEFSIIGTEVVHVMEVEEPGGTHVVNLSFDTLETWSPQSTKTHILRAIVIQDEKAVDVLEIPFGMSDFTVKDCRFYLNGRPIFLKGMSIHCTRSLLDPGVFEHALRELKGAGFNFVWFKDGPVPDSWLSVTDRLGLMACVSLDNGIEAYQSLCHNHPSLVAWHLKQGDRKNNPESANDENQYTASSRLCLFFDEAESDASDCKYIRPYKFEFEQMDLLRFRPAYPIDLETESYLRHVGDASRVTLVLDLATAELGDTKSLAALAIKDETLSASKAAALLAQHEIAEHGFGENELAGALESFEAMCKQSRGLQAENVRNILDALRCNPAIAGYCLAQLCDWSEGAGGGILKADGTAKLVMQTLEKAHRAMRPLIQLSQNTLIVRQESPVNVLIVNEGKEEGRAELSLQVVGPTNQVLWKKTRQIKIPRHGKELWQGLIAASGSVGMHKFVVRVIVEGKVIAEAVRAIHVLEEQAPLETPIHVYDPMNIWRDNCAKLAPLDNFLAPVIIIPPYADTIRAYPDNSFVQILAQVYGGAVAVFFSPPEDWNDLTEALPELPKLTQNHLLESACPYAHFTKIHPVYATLPTKTIMRQPYANLMPGVTYSEISDEIICGCFQGYNSVDPQDPAQWTQTILVLRYGAGRLVFSHLRLMENLDTDPLALRLLSNLITHFLRRSVPSKAPVLPPQPPVEWLRHERLERVWKWMVIGPFSNDHSHAGHHAAYAPEEKLDFQTPGIGWYRVLRWRTCYTCARPVHRMDFHAMCNPVSLGSTAHDYGTYYAYAEFTSEKRQELALHLRCAGALKVWMNDQLYLEVVEGMAGHVRLTGIKQGKNTLMIKLSKGPGSGVLEMELLTLQDGASGVQWWK